MKLQRHRIALLGACIASVLLSACGGGSGGMVRASPQPDATPAVVPGRSDNICPPPILGNCIADGSRRTADGSLIGSLYMTHGRDTAYALIKRDSPTLGLIRGEYRFGGGTLIEEGAIHVHYDSSLISNVTVQGGGYLIVDGVVRGSVTSQRDHDQVGHVFLAGNITGDVVNNGSFGIDIESNRVGMPVNRIQGNFRQTSTGALLVPLPTAGLASPPLQVTGRADIEGGTVVFSQHNDWDVGLYPLPSTPATMLFLHAGGGVFGEFARWTSPGLFVEGSLRYGSNDVWFDLTRVSVAAAMASNGIGSALTLASATNLDRLFARTDGLALMAPSSLSHGQHRVLASAGSVLRIDDVAQATRTLDSLSGAAHADALHNSLRQGFADTATAQRLGWMHPGFAAGAWSKTSVGGATSGFDQWMSPRLLLGVQAGQGSDSGHDTLGQSTRLSPRAGAYLRWFGDNGWYAGGSAGYAQHTLALDRTIDLDRGGQWNAHARHRFNVAGVQGEAGRRLSFARSTLAPYVTLDATALRSERTIEQGGTGFELALQPAMRAHLGAGLGLRYGREWRLGDTGWMRLDADARMQRQLADAGDPLRAAYVGVPDLWFDVPGTASATSGWLDLGLRGGFGRDWTWSLAHARPLAGSGSGRAWSIGLQRRF